MRSATPVICRMGDAMRREPKNAGSSMMAAEMATLASTVPMICQTAARTSPAGLTCTTAPLTREKLSSTGAPAAITPRRQFMLTAGSRPPAITCAASAAPTSVSSSASAASDQSSRPPCAS